MKQKWWILLTLLLCGCGASSQPDQTGGVQNDRPRLSASTEETPENVAEVEKNENLEKNPSNSNQNPGEGQNWTVFAMDTVMQFDAYGGSAALQEKVKRRVEELEGEFSTTQENSDIFHLNQEKTAELSADTRYLMQEALALGADPTAFGRDKNGRSVNLLADGVYQFTAAKSLGTQGLNGWIFGLIALDSARFAVPEDAVYTRATILQALVAAQEPEGGFGLTVGNSDVDLTAMTLQALAPYQNSTVTYTGTSGESVTIREVVRRALAWLSDQQTAEGDFISWDAANLESTAQVIIALCSLGVDPATDARFVKNGISAVDGLMRYRLDDGTFRHILTDGSDVMATEQALLAQEAMERLSAARRSLYDFREEMPEDVKTQVTALNEALTDVAVATPEEVQALYTRYLAIPAAERSYVFAAGALLDRMQELSLEITPEDPAQAYELRVAAEVTTSGSGAVVWIAAGAAVVVVAAGIVIWSKRRKICTK